MTSGSNQLAENSPDSIRKMVKDLDDRIILAKASDLARHGQYDRALELIHSAFADPASSIEASDLLARMLAQSGRLNEARAHWSNVIRLDPENRMAAAGIARIDRLSKKSVRIMGLRLAIVLLVAVLGLTFIVVYLLNPLHSLSAQMDEIKRDLPRLSAADNGQVDPGRMPGNVSPEEFANLRDALQEIHTEILNVADAQLFVQTRLDSLELELVAVEPEPDDPGSAGLDLAVPGVQIVEFHEGYYLQFDEGIFRYETLFTESGRRILSGLAQALSPYRDTYLIEVIGFSEPDELTYLPDQDTLRISRASVVVLHFLRSGAFLADDVVARLPAQELPPYPNDTYANRERNRTVLLQLRPK